MENPLRSARLIFRAVEPTEDEAFFLALQQDPISYVNSNAAVLRPQGTKHAKTFMKDVEEALLGVVICLPAPDANSKPIPIGSIHLSKIPPGLAHHRFSEIGIDIVKPYQGQGYGSEAINWIIEWGFDTFGLHRINIRAFEYNAGARKLYERLGFKLEGVSRELIWHKGRYWDDHQFGMLDREWRELRQQCHAS